MIGALPVVHRALLPSDSHFGRLGSRTLLPLARRSIPALLRSAALRLDSCCLGYTVGFFLCYAVKPLLLDSCGFGTLFLCALTFNAFLETLSRRFLGCFPLFFLLPSELCGVPLPFHSLVLCFALGVLFRDAFGFDARPLSLAGDYLVDAGDSRLCRRPRCSLAAVRLCESLIGVPHGRRGDIRWRLGVGVRVEKSAVGPQAVSDDWWWQCWWW